MRDIDNLAVAAQSDEKTLNQFINQYGFFILKCTSKVTHRYITKSDDEWSIALMAFHQAIQGYSLEKGNFLNFAELIIKRRLIDYLRSSDKLKAEVSVDPILFDTDPDEDDEDLGIRLAVAEKISDRTNNDLKLEIEAANIIFKQYNFSFYDLTNCSPQAKKTKLACANVIQYLLANPILVNELQSSHQIPIITIVKNTNVPRKIIERHRKYIIAAIVILSGEYPNLADYLRYIREENK